MPVNKAETVRCEIRDATGRILLLEKDPRAKNPGMLEFPGGKIDTKQSGRSTAEEQRATVIREVQEETGLDINGVPLDKIGSFSYVFEAGSAAYAREVHLFRAQLSKDGPEVEVNRTMAAEGGPEDKHAGFRWVTPEEFWALRRGGKVAANSIAPAIR